VPGTLYIVATPIGNLEDMTLRALRVLREADLIACEDTRQTGKLTSHFGIDKPMVSYHDHNESARTRELVAKLEGGSNIALVSDAGTPLVSDPGYRLVTAAIGAGITVVPIPGASAVLGALAGVDPRDSVTAESQGKASSDYTQFLDPRGLRGARIGVVRKLFGFHDGVDQLMNAAIDAMKREGADIIDPVELEPLGKIDDSELTVLLYELKADLKKYLDQLGPNDPVHSLQEIIAFNERNQQAEMPYFGQDLFLKSEAKGHAVLLGTQGQLSSHARPDLFTTER